MAYTSDAPTLIRNSKEGGFLRVNESFAEKVGIAPEELSKKVFSQWIVAEDQPLLEDLLAGKRESCILRHKTQDDTTLELHTRVSERQGDDCIVLAKFVESDEVSKNCPQKVEEANVKSTLHEIAHILEEQNPGYKCSILLVEDGKFVKGAGPSLPEDYNNAIDGFAVGPTVGSCGTAIYWNVPVIVCDIQNDPLWIPFAELAKTAGVAACWSHPFTSKSGRVLGALAFYSPEPRTPSPEQLQHLKAAATMTGLAVERGRAEEALREKHRQTLELEEQLRQAAKMEALGVLAGGVAHDFNNIMNTILANAEFSSLMLNAIPEQKEKTEIQARLEDVVSASLRAGHFCKQMLSYAGQGRMKKEKVEMGALVAELDSLVMAALSKKTVLDFELDEKSTFVNGDENQLLQVIMNLITNAGEALKENPAGRILVSSKIKEFDAQSLKKLSSDADDLAAGSYVCISVTDNGPGITDKVKERIFDPFFTTKATGRGLGLSAVKGIIKKHKGVIYLESVLGQGTTFTVLLPIIDQKVTSLNRPLANTTMEMNSTGKKRMLIADDEADLLMICAKTLEFRGFEVIQARDGLEAVNLFNESPNSFDCVLLDMSMPEFSGQEVAEKVSEKNQDVPIVLMSGYDEAEVNSRFDESILAGVLQKPFTSHTLFETLSSIMSNSKGQEEIAA